MRGMAMNRLPAERRWGLALIVGIFLTVGPAVVIFVMIMGAVVLPEPATPSPTPWDDPGVRAVANLTRLGIFAFPLGVGLIVLACVKLGRLRMPRSGSPM